MSDRSKKIFLIICITVPFFLYCFYYYSQMFKNAPYRFTDFESLVFKYGKGDSLVNQYDSRTGVYHYLDRRDSLVADTVKLRKDDLQYLHGKAAQLGFWNLPDEMLPPPGESPKTARFFLEFNYREKSKRVVLDAGFKGNEKMFNAGRSVIDEVQRVLNDASRR